MTLTTSQNALHFGMKCSKSLRFLGLRPRPRWGSLRRSPRPPCRNGLLAFGNRSFAPSALALSPTFAISAPPQFLQYLSPQSYVGLQIYASVYGPPYLFFCNSTTVYICMYILIYMYVPVHACICFFKRNLEVTKLK